jgi:hypothetical protein
LEGLAKEDVGMHILRPFSLFYVHPFGILWGHLLYFVVIWYILHPFGILCGHLVYFMVIKFIFSCFGMLYQDKSGNPVGHSLSFARDRGAGRVSAAFLRPSIFLARSNTAEEPRCN